jgi:hypothetical protein
LARVLAGAAEARTVTIGESVSKSLLCGHFYLFSSATSLSLAINTAMVKIPKTIIRRVGIWRKKEPRTTKSQGIQTIKKLVGRTLTVFPHRSHLLVVDGPKNAFLRMEIPGFPQCGHTCFLKFYLRLRLYIQPWMGDPLLELLVHLFEEDTGLSDHQMHQLSSIYCSNKLCHFDRQWKIR